MNGPAHFQMFAAYNRWANGRLYEAVGALTKDELSRDCRAFFGSVLGTLNHILVADRIWMARLESGDSVQHHLDEMLHPELADLHNARKHEDQRIIDYADTLSDRVIAEQCRYTTITNPTATSTVRGLALTHMFNHQTHHRGQAHGLLTQLDHDAPPLDLIYFMRERPLDGG